MSQTPACGAPQILEQRVLQIVRIADPKREYAHSTKHDGWQNDQKNAGHAAGWELPTLFLSHVATDSRLGNSQLSCGNIG